MNPAAKLATFGVALVAIVGAGAAVGAGVGPFDTSSDDSHTGSHSTTTMPLSGDMGGMDMGGSELPAGGLLVAQDGYRFQTDIRTITAGTGSQFTFQITGPAGRAVTRYDTLHDKKLHLVLVSGDLATYLHVHPTMADDGTWSVQLPALGAGPYRVFADFQPAGASQLTLGIDVTVPGDYQPTPLQLSKSTSVDGYDVELTGDPADGQVTVTVRQNGQVITTEPYLAAAGHLVAIRDGDLAYLHVHPIDEVPAGPVRFGISVPSAGTYGLYFDFQVGGVVRTAHFAVSTEAPAGIDHGDH
jgi:hypothetical protein